MRVNPIFLLILFIVGLAAFAVTGSPRAIAAAMVAATVFIVVVGWLLSWLANR